MQYRRCCYGHACRVPALVAACCASALCCTEVRPSLLLNGLVCVPCNLRFYATLRRKSNPEGLLKVGSLPELLGMHPAVLPAAAAAVWRARSDAAGQRACCGQGSVHAAGKAVQPHQPGPFHVLPPSLQGISFTGFGLGDSNYTRYQYVPRAVRQRLLDLGAAEVGSG